jgi:large subunit ribosomal protein L32
MAVPKRRRSKSKKRMNKANWKITAPQLRPCPSCGVGGLSHFACAECGIYNGRQVIQIKEKATEEKES